MLTPDLFIHKWIPLVLFVVHTSSACNEPCASTFYGEEIIPGTKCTGFYVCHLGKVIAEKHCGSPLVFDIKRKYCNYPYEVECNEVSCPPTSEPTARPTSQPSVMPTTSPTQKPTVNAEIAAMNYIKSKRSRVEKHVLIAETSSGITYPSVRYTFDDFIAGLQKMGIDGFGADFKFFLGEGDHWTFIHGLINVAAFLANAMVESIKDDSCDENNWQQVAGRYSISNACGMEGRSYQDEDCGEIYSCPVDPNMEMTAVTAGTQPRAPPPLKCRPKSGAENAFAGYWDTSTATLISIPYSNSAGRVDTEGCCWWGRGALHTRGTCNIGKFNYYVGKGAADRGVASLYPHTDVCQYPEATCASEHSHELRWTMSMFEWADRVQTYSHNNNGWDYLNQLTKFVDEGMKDDDFIDSTNRILSLGCHKDGCSPSREVRMADERRTNFYTIITDVFDIPSLIGITQEQDRPNTELPSTAKSQTDVPTPMPIPPTPLRPSEPFYPVDPVKPMIPTLPLDVNADPTQPPLTQQTYVEIADPLLPRNEGEMSSSQMYYDDDDGMLVYLQMNGGFDRASLALSVAMALFTVLINIHLMYF